MAAAARRVPYEFVLDELSRLEPVTRLFFGAHGVYLGERLVFILRERGDDDDGVWVGTTKEHHESLRRELPSLRSIRLFGPGESAWQNLPATAPTFEREAIRACELVLRGDSRIGRVPKPRRPRAKRPRR